MATFDDERSAVAAATALDQQFADLAARHPDRFRALATVPLPHVDAALEITAKALDELHMVGISLVTSVLGRPLSDPAFTTFFEELDRRAAVIHLHPAGVAACSPLIADSGLTWLVGAPVEDTVAAVQLIKAGIPSRFPHIRIINSHLGGMLPMILQRLDNLSPMHAPGMPEPASVAARRMWYDTVSHGSVPALRCAAESIGIERLLLGTDFPFEHGDLYRRAVDHIRDIDRPSNEVEAILGTTAQALLRL